MPSFLFRNRKVNYLKQGKGACCMLLHGFCEDSSMWRGFLNETSDKLCFIALDFPGFGGSESADYDLSIPLLADLVIALARHENCTVDCVIGHSMGGYVAIELASRDLGSTKKMAILNSHVFADTSDKKAARLKAISFIQRHGSAYYVRSLILNLFSPAFAASKEAAVFELIETAVQIDSDVIVQYLNAMANRSDHSKSLKAFEGSVLLIGGRLDTTFPLKNSLMQAALVQNGEVYLLEHSAHMCLIEETDETTSLICNFFNNLKF